MKLRKITIHNIASIADASIDFDSGALSGAGIFLITGRTGAGKSTILDAVCLAVYGATPRLDKAPRNSSAKEIDSGENSDARDTRQLLRRGAGEGFAELTFQGNDKKEYTARWSVRRARAKASGTLMRPTRSVICHDDSCEVTRFKEIDEMVERAIGLDFDQFCRTVLLAQGDFTRFLNAKDDEKAAILEKITRVDIYSRIGAAIFNRCREAENDYHTALSAAEAVKAMTREEEAANRALLADAEKALALADRNVELVDSHIAYRQAVADAEAAAATARAEAARAAEAENAPETERRRQLVSDWRETVEPRADLEAARAAEAAEAAATAALHKMKPLIAAHREALAEIRNRLSDAERQIALSERDNGSSPEQTERLEKASDIRTAASLLKASEAMLADDIAGIDNYRKEATALASAIEAAEAKARTLTEASDAAARLFDSLKDTVDRFAVSARHQLTPGCRCPVCLQKVETMPPAEAGIKAEIEKVRSAAAEARTNADNASKELDRLRRKQDSIALDLMPKAQRSMQRHSTECEARRAELKRLGIEASRLTSLDSIIAEAEEMTERLASIRKAEKRLAALRAEAARLRAEESTAASVMARVTEACPSDNDIKPSPMTKPSWADLQTDVVSLSGRIAEERSKRGDALARLEAFLAPRRDRFTKESLAALSAHKSLFIDSEARDLAGIKARVTASRHTLAASLLALRRVTRRRPAPLSADDDTPLAEMLASAKARRNEAAETAASLRASLRTDSEQRRLKEKLMTEALRLKGRYAGWGSLNALFGSATGSKFQRIAQSMILDSLAMSANRYMATLAPRYTLHVLPGTFTILVRDAWQGYAERPASTVSGGESFLVSLALALALSDISSELAVDTLFIDEGFGTLSGDALEGALETLRSLRRRGSRRVGIISHVAALSDRIPVRIAVERDGLTGPARVTVSES